MGRFGGWSFSREFGRDRGRRTGIKKLISHPAAKFVAEAVVHGFARHDEVPSNVT
jgi:hypothetical protein